jgi:hypothetical protein
MDNIRQDQIRSGSVIGNTYDFQRVILSPVSDEQQVDENLEPPFIRQRSGNYSAIFLDSFSYDDRLNEVQNDGHWLLESKAEIFVRRIKRLSVSAILMSNAIPNINPRNNEISFMSSVNGSVLTVSIPEGFYTAATATAALVFALNSVTLQSGITFTANTVIVGSDKFITLTGTSGYKFMPSKFTTTGHAFWGFDPNDTSLIGPAAPFYTTFNMGAITEVYSQYYDICSFALTQYVKASNTGNTVPSNLIGRVYTMPHVGNKIIREEFRNLTWINFSLKQTLQSVDLFVLDQFKQRIYVPQPVISNFFVTLAILGEL